MCRNHCESHCAKVSNNVSPSPNQARNGGRAPASWTGDQISVTAAPTQNATRMPRKSRAGRSSAECREVFGIELERSGGDVLLEVGERRGSRDRQSHPRMVQE